MSAAPWTSEHQRHALAWLLRAAAAMAEDASRVGTDREHDADAVVVDLAEGSATPRRSWFAAGLVGHPHFLAPAAVRRILRRIDALAEGRARVEAETVWCLDWQPDEGRPPRQCEHATRAEAQRHRDALSAVGCINFGLRRVTRRRVRRVEVA